MVGNSSAGIPQAVAGVVQVLSHKLVGRILLQLVLGGAVQAVGGHWMVIRSWVGNIVKDVTLATS